jgi:cysteine-rich repeat protein
MCTAFALSACTPKSRASEHEGKVTLAANVVTACPLILGIEALPQEVFIGSEVELSAKLAAPGAAVVWHADGGTFSSRTAPSTRFRCDLPGVQTVILNAVSPCRDRATIRVTCTMSETCGDGRQDFGEQCDDGGTLDGDGCSEWCLLEPARSAGEAGSGK